MSLSSSASSAAVLSQGEIQPIFDMCRVYVLIGVAKEAEQAMQKRLQAATGDQVAAWPDSVFKVMRTFGTYW